MRKFVSVLYVILLFGAWAISFSSCNRIEDTDTPRITELRFNIQVTNASAPDTKAVKTAWDDGDQIFVFFKVGDSYLDAIKYVTLTYDKAAGVWAGALSGSLADANDLGTAGTMYGIHFPFGGVAIASDGASGVSFLSSGNTNLALNDQPIYTHYLSGNTTYTVETEGSVGTLTGTFNLAIPDNYVYFFINKEGEKYNENEKYRLSAEGIIPTACTGFSGGTFSETEMAAGRPFYGYAYGDAGIAFSGKIDATWASEADHLFLLYAKHAPNTYDEPTLGKTFHGSLSSLASVRLNMSSGWTKYGFRGYEVSDGILMLDGGVFGLTEGNPFAMWDYYGQATSLGKYYFTWAYLKETLGAAGSGIKSDSDKLPNGWILPTSGSQNPPTTDWGKILMGAPKCAIKIEKADGTVEKVTKASKGCAFVKIENTYSGMLLLRDGAFIPKEGNLQYWGNDSAVNNISSEEYAVLLEAGCLFIPGLGLYNGSEWRYRGSEGNYQTASNWDDSKGCVMNFYFYNNKYTFNTSTSFITSRSAPVRLVRVL